MAAESAQAASAPGRTLSNVAAGLATASLVLLAGGALVIAADDGWFACHDSAWNAVRLGALGSSLAAALATLAAGAAAAIRGREAGRWMGLVAFALVVLGWAVLLTLGQHLLAVTYGSLSTTDTYCSKPDDPHGVRRHWVSGEGDDPDFSGWLHE